MRASSRARESTAPCHVHRSDSNCAAPRRLVCIDNFLLSLLDATIKAGNCYADDVCIANGAFSPSRPCFRCDSATKPKDLTGPITDNHCFFDGKCVSKGTMAPAYSGYNSAS